MPIGRVTALGKAGYLCWKWSDALWDKKPCEYRIKEITRARFVLPYEEALHACWRPTSHLNDGMGLPTLIDQEGV
jgi:hypothetical protein